jgi:DNA-binding XRE family transcriptional regulator
VSIGTAIAVASVNFVPNSFTQAQAAPIYYENLHAPSPILRNRFKAAREFLQLSQVQAANMLRVSESSVEKFEIGVVEKPTRDTVSRYLALIQLADLYADVVGSKTYLVRSFLNTRSYYYQDKTPIEFAASHDNGVFEMLSTERRKHA